MSLYDFIKNLQSQPETKKRKILFGLLLISLLLLVSFWVVDFKKRISQSQSLFFGFPEEQAEELLGEKEIPGPLAAIKEGFSLVVKDIKEKSGEFFSQTEEIFQDSQEKERPIYKLPVNE